MIAIWQMWREKARFTIGVCGVAFATVLILMQLGFQSALFDSSTKLHSAINGDLFVIDRKTSSLVSCRQFPRVRLYQVLSDPEVAWVSPIYVGRANCRVIDSEQSRPVFVYGINSVDAVFAFGGIEKLKNEQLVLFDSKSRRELQQKGNWLQLENKRLRIGGHFELGTSFGADGNAITSTTAFLKIFPFRNPRGVDIGVIRLRQGADVAAAMNRLQVRLPKDVRVLTKPQFIEFEQSYWRSTTAIGFIFRMGVVLSVVVGAIIVYQILYADISDHLKQYATLLAIGYSMRNLYDVLFMKAVLLAIFGFFPGVLVARELYCFTAANTGLPLLMDAPRVVLTLSLGIVMCCGAAVVSSAKLRKADPADVFAGG